MATELYTIDEWHSELLRELGSYVKARKRMAKKFTNEYPEKMTFGEWSRDFDWWGDY